MEIDFEDCKKRGEYFYSWPVKEYQGISEAYPDPIFRCPAPLERKKTQEIKDIALRACRSLGCLDFSRADIRLSKDEIPYVLEVNPLSGLDPKESLFTFIAKSAGMSYEKLINRILEDALKRYRRGRLIPHPPAAKRELATKPRTY